MRFFYEYHTSANERRSGVVDAASRDDAYASLRKQGIRASRVVEAPGFFNRLFGKGKRWLAIGFLFFVCCGTIAIALRFHNEAQSSLNDNSAPMSRRQIYGDPALMERLEMEDYASVFETPADRFLAHFAQPGQIHRFPSELDTPAKRRGVASRWIAALVGANYEPSICLLPADGREVRELKRIVMWMREELRAYLANGNGNPSSYVKRLDERLMREVEIYMRTKNELEKVKDPFVWEKRNTMLRNVGLATIPMPVE